ncbi:MAG: DUF2179 domain-containing protein [Bacillus subtilis]|nr:DUF2179 domain-containing protein [Bacillus subtilis]
MADMMAQTMPHGITVTDAIGWYTRQPKKMIHTVISVHEIDQYVKMIEVDRSEGLHHYGRRRPKSKGISKKSHHLILNLFDFRR